VYGVPHLLPHFPPEAPFAENPFLNGHTYSTRLLVSSLISITGRFLTGMLAESSRACCWIRLGSTLCAAAG
jgi:hypothetical protein